jgi:hypothetical protein
MVRPRVADGEDGTQIWRVAGNILNKQPTRSGPPSLEVGRGANNSLPGGGGGPDLYEMLHRASELKGVLVNTVMNFRIP